MKNPIGSKLNGLNFFNKIKGIFSAQKFFIPFNSKKVGEKLLLESKEIHLKTDTEGSGEELRYWIDKGIALLFDFK